MAEDGIPQDNMGTTGGQTGQTATTTAQAGEFGTSDFGERMDYSKPKYQDLWAFILFYVHVALIFILVIYFWAVAIPDKLDESGLTPSPTRAGDDDEIENDEDTTGVWITLIAALFAGILFGLVWLQCMKQFAEQIIKILLFVQIACWVLVVIIGLATGLIFLTVIGVIFLLITCLYTWCIWRRIPFAAACLSIASQIAQMYSGTIWVSLLTVFINFFWICVWIFAFYGWVIDVLLQAEIDNTDAEFSQLTYFLFCVSLYWGVNVWRNVSHTTTCGVAATWYFNPGELDKPSKGAYKRTMTTSFGSICFGSLLVAILQAIRALLRANGDNGCAQCLLACIERLMRYFNKYAFAQVAIYGTSFWQSAKATWDLFMSNGIGALINDDLSGLALTAGCVLGMVVAAVVGGLIGSAFYPNAIELVVALALVGAVLGYYACCIILIVVASGVVAIFVCFAEDPAACAQNRPEAFQKLTGVSEDMANMARNQGVMVQAQHA